jgi:hypothetical protein
MPVLHLKKLRQGDSYFTHNGTQGAVTGQGFNSVQVVLVPKPWALPHALQLSNVEFQWPKDM